METFKIITIIILLIAAILDLISGKFDSAFIKLILANVL